jgi:hypothetical protein
MKYDFIEIGTSNFDTLIEVADDNTVGLSIEPIKYYLDQLPNKSQVKKLNLAVSRTDESATLDVYFVPELVIINNGLPDWLRGCNSVGQYHFQHTKLGITHLVTRQSVPVIPIGQLFHDYNVTELDYLKIDTEGSDCAIMLHLYKYLMTQPTSRYPKRILFESNELAVPAEVELVKTEFIKLGYTVIQASYDTIMEFRE